MKHKKVLLIMIIFLGIILYSCSAKEEKLKSFKIYYNKNTVQEIEVIKGIAKKYSEKEKRNVEFIGLEDEEKIFNYIGEDKESSIVLLDGYAFIEFVNKDALRNLSYLYKEKNTREKFSVITNIYGRDSGNYYGIGLMPFSLELVCNKEALEKKGVEIKENNLSDVIMMLKEKEIKIPTYIKSEYSKELLLSALVANDTIIYENDETQISGVLEEEIYSIKNGQRMFEEINKYYKEGSFREENFIEGNEELVQEFNNGKIPVILTTTLTSDKFKTDIDTVVVNKLPIENKFVGAPVGVDIIITSSIGNSNGEEVDRFLRYLIQGDGIKDLSNQNIITGNKEGDSALINIQGEMASTIQSADEINKLYFNIISNKGIWNISEEVGNVMRGEYDGKEWERILEKK